MGEAKSLYTSISIEAEESDLISYTVDISKRATLRSRIHSVKMRRNRIVIV